MSADRPLAKHPILDVECPTKDRLLDVVSQLADQRKQMAITIFDDGWKVSYSTGPSRRRIEEPAETSN